MRQTTRESLTFKRFLNFSLLTVYYLYFYKSAVVLRTKSKFSEKNVGFR